MLISFDSLIDRYKFNIKGIIHIGAHFGQEYNDYKRHGIENVIFFEPVRATFEHLLNSIKDENIVFVNKALGNENKDVTMYTETANQGQSSSVLKPVKHLTQYPHITFNGTEVVKQVTLDSFFKESYLKAEDYNFINIDVQGYELEVFKGAINTLKNIDCIYTEVNNDEVYEDCTRVEELDKFLKEFKRVETSWEGVTWGDAFYIKEH